MAGRSKIIHPDQILGRKSDYDKTWGRIAAEDLGDVEHQIMVRQVEREASKLPKNKRQRYISNKLSSLNELLHRRGLLTGEQRESPRTQREYAQEYLGVVPQLRPGDILRKNKARNLSSGYIPDSVLQIVEQSIKKGGSIKRKRGGSISRKTGGKIMQGYKAGGKV